MSHCTQDTNLVYVNSFARPTPRPTGTPTIVLYSIRRYSNIYCIFLNFFHKIAYNIHSINIYSIFFKFWSYFQKIVGSLQYIKTKKDEMSSDAFPFIKEIILYFEANVN